MARTSTTALKERLAALADRLVPRFDAEGLNQLDTLGTLCSTMANRILEMEGRCAHQDRRQAQRDADSKARTAIAKKTEGGEAPQAKTTKKKK